jgi:hypothetical protein
MQLLEAADQVPVTDGARQPRRRVTQSLRETYTASFFAPLQTRAAAWLKDSDSLFDFRDNLVHSVGGWKVHGNGDTRFVREHPRVTGRVRIPEAAPPTTPGQRPLLARPGGGVLITA